MRREGASAEVDWVGPPCAADCQEVDLPWQEQDAGENHSFCTTSHHFIKNKSRQASHISHNSTQSESFLGAWAGGSPSFASRWCWKQL